MKKEHPSVLNMWKGFLESIGENVEETEKQYSSWHFEITEKGANSLAELVINGVKKATAASLWVEEYDNGYIPKEGDYSIITNWDGVAKCIIQTKRVNIVPYNQVTEEFARIEGEGDLSLDYWRKVHEIYYIKECERIGKKFTQEMPVICEEFDVVFK
ncbi:ASCH domain-containing protein [Anaerosolibacter sp.]|uniref:ASCH domain-containing protein n=1 Tax=Anaerosolibacter sp. TaxID=1872527 RepID=UPI0039EF1AF0